MKASYTSTGSGGTDYEVDVAAALLARLIAGGIESVLLPQLEPTHVRLQHRSGPLGFDDFVVSAVARDGTPQTAYLQAKRRYALGDTDEFRVLVRALWDHLKTNQSIWTATLVAGRVSPTFSDVDTILQSARAQDGWDVFENVWAQDGVLNAGKRNFLQAVRKALSDKPAQASFEVLRRLRVVWADFDITASINRQAAIELLSHEVADPSTAATLFSELRSIALRDGKVAASYTRADLLADLPRQYSFLPSRRFRSGIDNLEAAGRDALASIASHIGLRAGQPAGLCLLRSELVAEGRQLLGSKAALRIVGEGGAGKSAVLRRIVQQFEGTVLVLKDDRVDGHSWQTYARQLGLDLSADEVAVEFASRGPCLLAIDGADRLLLSERKGVLADLLAAIAASPLRDRWSIMASARDFQSRDLFADALAEAGLPTGGRIIVAGLGDKDIQAIGQALPMLKAVASRSDLGDRNRVLFLFKEMLASPHLGALATEVQLAHAWANRGIAASPADPWRDRALAEMGELLLRRPTRRPGVADLDPQGLRSLEAEESVTRSPGRDAILLAHDVHEDWILARTFHSHQTELPALLRAADEPLGWLRAMRVFGQALLEEPSGPSNWLATVRRFEAEPDLDPAWLRSLIVAPLYSERSLEAMKALEPALVADDGRLLIRLVETLLVSEFELEAEHLGAANPGSMQHRSPVWRSWSAFIRWSVETWRGAPVAVIPLIAQVAHHWCSYTQGHDLPIVRAVVRASLSLLCEIEDCEYPEKWDDRRRPFDDPDYRNWDDTERLLRNAVARGAKAAPDEVRSYLERLTSSSRLRNPAEDLIERHGQIPVAVPQAYINLLIAYLTPRKRRPRYEGVAGLSDCFRSYDYHHAGIRHVRGFFPPAPDRAGFSALFTKDEAGALRLFHRLEMRASVYLRNYWRRREGRRLRPIKLPRVDGEILLWGNEFEYQWSRGVLGSDVLGSCYLALDDWIWAQVEKGRSVEELGRLILQRNGLATTAAILINVIALKVDEPGTIDAAASFLAAPRLWDYDMRRFVSLRHHQHPLAFMHPDWHFQAADAIWQRWRRRTFLSNDLMLRFHLRAGNEAKGLLATARQHWVVADLASHDDELEDEQQLRHFEDRLARIRSDTDPANVATERLSDGKGLRVWIEPPADQMNQTLLAQRETQQYDSTMLLLNWVIRTERGRHVDDTISVEQALENAKTLQNSPELEGESDDAEGSFFRRSLADTAITGVAWAASRFAPDDLLDRNLEWISAAVLAGCQTLEAAERDTTLVDGAVLAMHPLLFGAKGAAALIARNRAGSDLITWTRYIAAGRLIEPSAELIAGLDWKGRPRQAWVMTVLALDQCVHLYPRPWRTDDGREKASVERVNERLHRQSLRKALPPWTKTAMPRLPRPITRWWFYPTSKGPVPFAFGKVRSNWAFQWDRAGKLLAVTDMNAVVADTAISSCLQRYLLRLVEWTRKYSEGKNNDFDTQFPHELGSTLAEALGRLAAAGGPADLWRALARFQGRDNAHRMIGDYLKSVTGVLIGSGRAPDDQFWGAWRPAATWLLKQHEHRRGGTSDHVEEWVSAAGFMSVYASPLPDDWPHLDAILPEIDRWAQMACGSKSAARRLIEFGVRLDTAQRSRWLLGWAGLMVERRKADREFWGHGNMGDELALLLEPLAAVDDSVRREVRRLISVIADGGALGARTALARLAGQRRSS